MIATILMDGRLSVAENVVRHQRSRLSAVTQNWPVKIEIKGSNLTPGVEGAQKQNRPFRPPGTSVGRKSQCEPLAEVILAKVKVGLSAQRIYQDLIEENGFSDSYQSVKRFVHKLRAKRPERIYRLECQPGEEVQLDFGLEAPIDYGPRQISAQLGAAAVA
jgi:hypothetical protein